VVGERTRLVAVTGASNLLGTKPPVNQIAQRAHKVHSVATDRTPTLLLTFHDKDAADAYRFLAARDILAPAGTFCAYEPLRALNLEVDAGLRVGLAPTTTTPSSTAYSAPLRSSCTRIDRGSSSRAPSRKRGEAGCLPRSFGAASGSRRHLRRALLWGRGAPGASSFWASRQWVLWVLPVAAVGAQCGNSCRAQRQSDSRRRGFTRSTS
jgi:hypothetical protein